MSDVRRGRGPSRVSVGERSSRKQERVRSTPRCHQLGRRRCRQGKRIQLRLSQAGAIPALGDRTYIHVHYYVDVAIAVR